MKTFKTYLKNPPAPATMLSWPSSLGELREAVKTLSWASTYGEHRGPQKPLQRELHDTALRIKEEASDAPHIGAWKLEDERNPPKSHDHPDLATNISKKQRHTVRKFTSGGEHNVTEHDVSEEHPHATAKSINTYLRNRSGDTKRALQGISHHDVHEAAHEFSKLYTPENTNKTKLDAYCGVPAHIGKRMMNHDGKTPMHMGGFVSTSLERRVAHDYASHDHYKSGEDTHVVHFHAEPGTWMSVAKHSAYPDENEGVIHHGARIEHLGSVKHSDYKGKTHWVHNVKVHKDFKPIDDYGPYKD